jgi:hypothetical protein
LEVAFGPRATVDNAPIKLKCHGLDLLAVAGVVTAAITRYYGENPVLLKWIDDLTKAVETVPKVRVIICGWIYAHEVNPRERLRQRQGRWGNDHGNTLRNSNKSNRKMKPQGCQYNIPPWRQARFCCLHLHGRRANSFMFHANQFTGSVAPEDKYACSHDAGQAARAPFAGKSLYSLLFL